MSLVVAVHRPAIRGSGRSVVVVRAPRRILARPRLGPARWTVDEIEQVVPVEHDARDEERDADKGRRDCERRRATTQQNEGRANEASTKAPLAEAVSLRTRRRAPLRCERLVDEHRVGDQGATCNRGDQTAQKWKNLHPAHTATGCKKRAVPCARKVALLRSWMRLGVYSFESFDAGMRIDLRGRNRCVAEQLLDGTKVGSRIEQVCGECMAKGVYRETCIFIDLTQEATDDCLHHAHSNALAALGHKERRTIDDDTEIASQGLTLKLVVAQRQLGMIA